jgi:hypothetical protein
MKASALAAPKFFPMPHEMPLKVIAGFERHGVGANPKLYIGREMARRALACDGINRHEPTLIIAGR